MEESDTIVELEMKQLGADVIAMEGSEFMLMVELLNKVGKGEGKEPTELEKFKSFLTTFLIDLSFFLISFSRLLKRGSLNGGTVPPSNHFTSAEPLFTLRYPL